MPRTITAIARKKLGWMPKAIRAISDKDCPAGKKQKQVPV